MRTRRWKSAGWLAAALAILLGGCTWVRVNPEAEAVRVAEAEDVVDCTHLGRTTAMLRHKVAGISRSRTRVARELEDLARNAAAELEGDTVVPVAAPEEGRQAFEVYRCAP